MSARDRILRRLAAGRRAGGGPLPDHVEPALAGDPVERFTAALEAAAGTWERLDRLAQLPERVAAYCQRQGVGGPLAVAPALAGLDWEPAGPAGLEVEPGTTDGRARVAVSQARLGIAETGSLVLASGPLAPTRLNFLPDHHLVVLGHGAVVARLEDALQGEMPRALNLITGPSRTADVEQTLQLGAHGPRRLHLLLSG